MKRLTECLKAKNEDPMVGLENYERLCKNRKAWLPGWMR